MKTSITANENAIKLPYKHHVFPAMTFFGEPQRVKNKKKPANKPVLEPKKSQFLKSVKLFMVFP